MSDCLKIAEEYYEGMRLKDLDQIGKCLHPDAFFKGPLVTLSGKDAILEPLSGFLNAFTSLTVRSKFANGHEVVMLYDLHFPDPVGDYPVAAHIECKDQLISKITLYCDSAPLKG